MSMVMDKFITAEDIADALGISYDTVARLLRNKEIPGYKNKGSWRVKEIDFLAWLEKQKNTQEEDQEDKK